MKILKRSITVALLLFVGATVGLLIAQEIAQPSPAPVTEGAQTDMTDATDAGTATTESEIPTQEEAMLSGSAPEEDQEATTPEEFQPESSIVAEPDAEEMGVSEPESICRVEAIYFHNTLRCRTCRKIEEAARAVVETGFSDEVASDQLRWSTINMERQQQYVERYDLVKPTLVLVRMVDEEEVAWVALDETWSHIRNESRFADYVERETRTFLEACP